VQVDGQEVEEQRALLIRCDRDHAPAALGRQPVVQGLQVRRLAAQAGAVVDDLEMDLVRPVVDERQGASLSGR